MGTRATLDLTCAEARAHLQGFFLHHHSRHQAIGFYERTSHDEQRETEADDMGAGFNLTGPYNFGSLPAQLRTILTAAHQVLLQAMRGAPVSRGR